MATIQVSLCSRFVRNLLLSISGSAESNQQALSCAELIAQTENVLHEIFSRHDIVVRNIERWK